MSGLVLQSVSKDFGSLNVIRDVSVSIADGELVVLVGPSGCGKSTLLRMISGLEETTSGRISIGDTDVTAVDPADRGVAMVFQSYALYPHMTVRENIGFGLRMGGMSKPDVAARVEEAARVLELSELLDRKPKALSGGQRQRVAIGRAIVRQPDVFLFDEPLSNLDAELRVQMRLEIARLHHRLGATMIFVTHDQVEAMTLADRIVVLRAGVVEQVGTPVELYERPANQFVAGFIGSPRMNFLRLDAEGTDLGTLGGQAPSSDAVTLGIRPEHLKVDESGELKGEVELIERLGAETFAYVRIPGREDNLTVRLPGDADLRPGVPVALSPERGRIHWFSADGRTLAPRARPQ